MPNFTVSINNIVKDMNLLYAEVGNRDMKKDNHCIPIIDEPLSFH